MSKEHTPWHGIVGPDYATFSLEDARQAAYALSSAGVPASEIACALFATNNRPTDDTPEGWLRWAGLDWKVELVSIKEEA